MQDAWKCTFRITISLCFVPLNRCGLFSNRDSGMAWMKIAINRCRLWKDIQRKNSLFCGVQNFVVSDESLKPQLITKRPKFSLLYKQQLASQGMLCSKQFYESKSQLSQNTNIYPVGLFKIRKLREFQSLNLRSHNCQKYLHNDKPYVSLRNLTISTQ